MNRITLFTIIVFIATSFSLNSENIDRNLIDKMLKELDEVVDNDDMYKEIRAHRADSLVQAASHRKGQQRIDLYVEAYNIYSHYQCDSAVKTLQRLSLVPEASENGDVTEYLKIANGEILGIMGLYVEAYETLQSVNVDELSHQNKLFLKSATALIR